MDTTSNTIDLNQENSAPGTKQASGRQSADWPEIWQAAYQILEQNIVQNQLKTWVLPLEFITFETKESSNQMTVKLGAPNDFSLEWVRDHYKTTIESALSQVTGFECKLDIIVQEKTDAEGFLNPLESPRASDYPSSSSGLDRGTVLSKGVSNSASTQSSSSRTTRSNSGYSSRMSLEPSIDSRFTFDTFVVGASNQFAHASAISVSERPATQYNPLFIYSSPGLGKTHLLHAIGNYLLKKNPSYRVYYVSAESFVNELIESLQHQRMSKFRTKYRTSYDVLLIDDIQFIAGKKQTEEEFFHTFNALYGSKRQIILASDRPPKDIEKLEERIRTRFEWGLVADIAAPEIETRIAILKAKAESDDIYLPDEVATFLATHIKNNVRELEGILIRLQAQASLTGAEISLEMAKQELKLASAEQSSQITVESIQETVAKHFSIKVLDLKSSNRAKSVSLPRQIAMYLIRKYTSLGFKEIGQYFGGKDHSTILHACNKIEKSFDADKGIKEDVESIQNKL